MSSLGKTLTTCPCLKRASTQPWLKSQWAKMVCTSYHWTGSRTRWCTLLPPLSSHHRTCTSPEPAVQQLPCNRPSSITLQWKHTLVQPIFKKGDRSQAASYRPISLTCICCKRLEHIVWSEIIGHIHHDNIIIDAQHSSRKRHSCET